MMELLNALYIAFGRNGERCRRQLNVVNNVALPSANIRQSFEAGGRERANGERNLKQILDITAVWPFGIMSITRFHLNEECRSRHRTLTRYRCR